MSTDDAPPVAPAKGKEKKKSRGNLLPAIVVAAGLFGAAFMMKGGTSKNAAASTPASPSATTTVPTDAKTLAQIAKLDDITLNLSDGHYLKVGLALQLATKAAVTDYTTGGAASKALDLAISVLGTGSYNQFVQPSGRDAAKAALEKKIVAAYNGQVLGIYFTDFVMQ